MSETGTTRKRKRTSPKISEHAPAPVVSSAADQPPQAQAALDALARTASEVENVKEALAALIAENAHLREENLRLTREARGAPSAGHGAPPLERALEKSALYRAQLQQVLDDNARLEQRIAELDWANSSMMSTYVSSFQLHASLELDEVLGVIEEVLVNFIGVRSWAVIARHSDESTYRVARESGLEGRFPPKGIEPQGILADALSSGSPYLHPTGFPSPDEALAIVPLLSGKAHVGAILIYSLLPHKDHLVGQDLEMFSLLGGHAASALASALLYQRALERARALESMVKLV